MEDQTTEIIQLVLLALLGGFLIGSLWEKWKYFKKTGKHLQDIKQIKGKS